MAENWILNDIQFGSLSFVFLYDQKYLSRIGVLQSTWGRRKVEMVSFQHKFSYEHGIAKQQHRKKKYTWMRMCRLPLSCVGVVSCGEKMVCLTLPLSFYTPCPVRTWAIRDLCFLYLSKDLSFITPVFLCSVTRRSQLLSGIR